MVEAVSPAIDGFSRPSLITDHFCPFSALRWEEGTHNWGGIARQDPTKHKLWKKHVQVWGVAIDTSQNAEVGSIQSGLVDHLRWLL